MMKKRFSSTYYFQKYVSMICTQTKAHMTRNIKYNLKRNCVNEMHDSKNVPIQSDQTFKNILLSLNNSPVHKSSRKSMHVENFSGGKRCIHDKHRFWTIMALFRLSLPMDDFLVQAWCPTKIVLLFLFRCVFFTVLCTLPVSRALRTGRRFVNRINFKNSMNDKDTWTNVNSWSIALHGSHTRGTWTGCTTHVGSHLHSTHPSISWPQIVINNDKYQYNTAC